MIEDRADSGAGNGDESFRDGGPEGGTAAVPPSGAAGAGGPGVAGGPGGHERLFRADFAGLVHAVAIVVGDIDAASDVVQEAFLQASRHWSRVATYENPAAWLRRVAVSRALDERRRLAALPRLARSVSSGPGATGGPAAATDHEPAVDFDAAVARLPRQQRAVVALFYGADLPVADVAAALGIAEGTVKSHLHDARRALAPQLEVDDGHR